LASPPISTPYHRGIPLPPPVSPLIYGILGGLNRGDNTLTEIFPEKIRKVESTPISKIKIFQNFSEIWNIIRI